MRGCGEDLAEREVTHSGETTVQLSVLVQNATGDSLEILRRLGEQNGCWTPSRSGTSSPLFPLPGGLPGRPSRTPPPAETPFPEAPSACRRITPRSRAVPSPRVFTRPQRLLGSPPP